MRIAIPGALALAMIVLSLPACAPYADVSPADRDIVGKWNWKLTSGGITGKQTYTPESAGYTKQIRFSAEGEYEELRDDTLYIAASYTVTRKRTIFGMHDVIVFADPKGTLHDLVIMRVTETELGLSDPFPDGFGHTYVRARE